MGKMPSGWSDPGVKTGKKMIDQTLAHPNSKDKDQIYIYCL